MNFSYQTVTVKCELVTPEGQKKLNDVLNERGAEGWELVHIVSQTRYCHLVLKKGVPDALVPPKANIPLSGIGMGIPAGIPGTAEGDFAGAAAAPKPAAKPGSGNEFFK